MRREFSYIILFVCLIFLVSCSEKQNIVEKWSDAVKNRNIPEAIKYADELIKDKQLSFPEDDYIDFFIRNNFTKEFLFIKNFNGIDFKLWDSAFYFKEKAEELSDGSDPKELVEYVKKKVIHKKNTKTNLLWPKTILQTGEGLCDRSVWVLCELAFQKGYDTRVIYLYRPGSDSSFHTICELTRNGRSFVVDTVNDRYVECIFENLNKNNEKLKELWPNETIYYDCIENAVSFIPAFASDYLIKEQTLYRIVSKVMKKDSPRFGVSPKKRTLFYKKYLKDKNIQKPIPILYWHYPLRLLQAEVINNSNKK